MKVTLFRDLKEEDWHSMNRYASALLSAMQNDQFSIFNFHIEDFVVPRQDVTPSKVVNLYCTRYLYYPFKARLHQGDVNHIVDHSYAHLVYALDPKKTVVTCHDLNPLKYEESWLNLKLFKYSVGGLKKAARIIAVSKATKKDLMKFLKIDVDRIRVIPSGVEEKFRVIEDREYLSSVRSKFNLPDGKNLLHVGGSAYNKNIQGILRAFSILNSQFSPLNFVKAGSDFTESQKSLIKRLELEDHVRSLGQVSDEDLVALYNIADVFVMPSLYEGFGLPVLEAMACGTPVITSKLSSLPEVAGEAAVLVDPYNSAEIAIAMERVLNFGDGERQRQVQKGLEHAKGFTWEKTAQETLKVYEELL